MTIFSLKKGFVLTFCWIQIHIFLQQEVLAFIFIFQEVVLLLPPSHKWYYKQTKIMLYVTKLTLSERIYPIECTNKRIEV